MIKSISTEAQKNTWMDKRNRDIIEQKLSEKRKKKRKLYKMYLAEVISYGTFPLQRYRLLEERIHKVNYRVSSLLTKKY